MFLYEFIKGLNKERNRSHKIWTLILFFRLPVASTERIVPTEKYPDSGIIKSYDNDDYFQGYGQIKEAFRALTKDDILQPNKSDDDFLSSNVRVDNFGYSLYVLDIQYLPIFSTTSQPINVEFKFDGIVAKDIN